MSGLARDTLLRWRLDPVAFVREAIGAEPDEWQRKALSKLAKPGAKVSIRSCHGPGKSCVAAWAVLWFIFTHFPCRILLTAPAAPQLETVLWPEIGIWLAKMPEQLRKCVNKTSDTLEWVGHEDQSFAVARTAREDKPEALAGMHGVNVLIVVDEASGVSEKVYETIQGSLTDPGNVLLLISNPTRNTGTFYDSHHKLRSKYDTIHVSHRDSDRVTDEYVETMRLQYGEESNVYRVRCLGEFPVLGDDQVVSLERVQLARTRHVDTLDVRPVWGLDVARFGWAKTALARRRGNTLIQPIETRQGWDTMQTAGWVAREYDECRDEDIPHRIFVDVIGVGAGVLDRLRELDIPAQGVNVAETPLDPKRFMRLRDELWWKGREWFERGDVYLPPGCESLEAQLVAPTYRMLSTGKIQVESKEELRDRGVESPDEADAFLLTLAERERKAERPINRGYTRRTQEQRHAEGYDWVA